MKGKGKSPYPLQKKNHYKNKCEFPGLENETSAMVNMKILGFKLCGGDPLKQRQGLHFGEIMK